MDFGMDYNTNAAPLRTLCPYTASASSVQLQKLCASAAAAAAAAACYDVMFCNKLLCIRYSCLL